VVDAKEALSARVHVETFSSAIRRGEVVGYVKVGAFASVSRWLPGAQWARRRCGNATLIWCDVAFLLVQPTSARALTSSPWH